MSESTHIEFRHTPDTSNRQKLHDMAEAYRTVMTCLLDIHLDDSPIPLNLISYGCGSGADVIALHRMNPYMHILAAIDGDPTKKSIIDPQTQEKIVDHVTTSDIVGFINNPNTQPMREQANIISGTRLGPETIKHILRSLRDKEQFLGIFSVGSLGTHFSGTESLLRDVFGEDWGNQFGVKIAGEGNFEDLFVITPKRQDNLFYIKYFQNNS